jgi:hypothetical protein
VTGPGNELIDVQTLIEDGAWIDSFYFITRLHRLMSPEIPEERARRWLGDQPTTEKALDELLQAGLIAIREGRGWFRLALELDRRAPRVAAVSFSTSGDVERWAAALGDGGFADPAPSQPGARRA